MIQNFRDNDKMTFDEMVDKAIALIQQSEETLDHVLSHPGKILVKSRMLEGDCITDFWFDTAEGVKPVIYASIILPNDTEDGDIIMAKEIVRKLRSIYNINVDMEPLEAEPMEHEKMISPEMEEVLDGAQATAQRDPIDVLRKKGYVNGRVVIISDISKQYNLGIIYGLERFEDGIWIKCTDGRFFKADTCTPIKDVDKRILQYIHKECEAIQDRAINLQAVIHHELEHVIYTINDEDQG